MGEDATVVTGHVSGHKIDGVNAAVIVVKRPAMAEIDILNGLLSFSSAISEDPMIAAFYRPEPWAEVSHCFENAFRKATEIGGKICVGWTFFQRFAQSLPHKPAYLVATHHAVCHAPDKTLVDVTPFNSDPNHHPLQSDLGHVIFKVDHKAEPYTEGRVMCPLPLRFFPLSGDAALATYLEQKQREEDAACREAFVAACAQHNGNLHQQFG